MLEEDKISKAIKKLAILFFVYIIIAFSLMGFSFFRVSSYNRTEASDLSELVSSDAIETGQYVQLSIDTMPLLMTPTSEKDSQLYYVTDTNDHIYIMSLSNKTFQSITETLDVDTGKLQSLYQLKGTTDSIDAEIKAFALSNSFKLSKNNELTSDNFSEYIGEFYVNESFISDRMLTLYYILALLGILFLVFAFGYVIPSILKVRKGDFGILDEKRMMQALKKNLPDGETLAVGVHGIGIQSEITQVFGKCIYVDDQLIPSENGSTIQVKKSKFAKYDVYIGVSEHYLILAECQKYKHLYEFDDAPNVDASAIKEIDTCVSLEDIGVYFPLAEIISCTAKNTWMGAINCTITIKNGSLLKIMLPKRGGLGIPHHEEYRKKLLVRLRANQI